MISVKCDWCGKEFERKPASIKKHNYCCRSCLGKANGARSRKSNTQVCEYCGKTFDRKNKHGNRDKHHFCSPECAYAFRSQKASVICEWCGREFLKKRSDIARSEHNFCSRGCCQDYIDIARPADGNKIVAGERLYRYLAAKKIGRPLTSNEEVHHIDGNHNNNSPENLQVLTANEHARIHAAQKERNSNGRFVKKN
ncbi:MAG: HNH endonuclease [Oscillospiraceae bacterium]|nr:HNH endonuclease [Oscillospiraceae bacterium]